MPASKCLHDKFPSDKADLIKDLERKTGKGKVAFVGDAGNDLTAMQASSVAFAVLPKEKTFSTNLVRAVSGVDLPYEWEGMPSKDPPRVTRVPIAIEKGNSCFWLVIANLCVALVCMLVTVVFALTGKVPLWLAVTLHEGGAVIVVCISLLAL